MAEEVGPGAVTLRAVAVELDVSPSSLYHHVDDRADLLAGMADQLLEDVPDPPPAPWPDRLRDLFLALRYAAHEHPRTFPLVLDHPHSRHLERLRLSGMEAVAEALSAAGAAREHLAPCEAVVWTLLLGTVVRESLGQFRHHRPGGPDAVAAAVLAAAAHHIAWVAADPAAAHRRDPGTEWADDDPATAEVRW